MTRVSPTSISAEPSACLLKCGVMRTRRISSDARPSARGLVVMGGGGYQADSPQRHKGHKGFLRVLCAFVVKRFFYASTPSVISAPFGTTTIPLSVTVKR